MYAVTETDTDKEEYWELKEDAAKEEEEAEKRGKNELLNFIDIYEVVELI